MKSYWQKFIDGYTGYARYLFQEITFQYDYKPWYENYFYLLILVSLIFLVLEWVRPWRKNQARFRKDFWLDTFYMFFNFFLFSLIIYNSLSNVVVDAFNDFLALFGISNTVAIEVSDWPRWTQLLLMFVLRDFIQWWVHRWLHRSKFLWQYHKLHHSVLQMGFAAHLRYHWMETIVYRSVEYLPLAMIGFGIDDFFIVHMVSLSIGHFNHSNLNVNLGPLKYLLNNPQMHIWHHAYNIPENRKYGVNFGISLSVWDYMFGTNYIPHSGRDIPLGFKGVEKYPQTFGKQVSLRPGASQKES